MNEENKLPTEAIIQEIHYDSLHEPEEILAKSKAHQKPAGSIEINNFELVRRSDVVELIQSFEERIFEEAPQALPIYRELMENFGKNDEEVQQEQ